MSDRNFAIIIDEAHSSQSGIASDKMNASMQQKDSSEQDADTGGADTDELIEKLMKERKMSTNSLILPSLPPRSERPWSDSDGKT